ncbi:hypothetical protein ACFO25_03115 [Paenactinomyces guangxiensis]|uniref:ABC transporter permease n=1 Tax=Paenactinomyces guangxiensis TaxID=1490290 RepID=A0A7W1WTA5_9BACL|nr:hypothetical protein [Paenactinomyces guangxiensis]MBA4495670.1 hypothetical protein [Paenactinomyces guangxiensis]MBH8592658.1 hypothetical protein [Paenactinomyces guangxiensis]
MFRLNTFIKMIAKLNWHLYYEIFITFLVLSYAILLLQSTFDSIPDLLSEREIAGIDRVYTIFSA